MGDGLGNLQRENETGRSLAGPSGDGGARRRAVKSAIHFDGVEFCGVVSKKIARLHSGGIERAFPTSGRERGCANSNVGFGFRRHDAQSLT
jgi:hypothetical protein